MDNIDITKGLTKEQVQERVKQGKVNYDTTVKTKSIKAAGAPHIHILK